MSPSPPKETEVEQGDPSPDNSEHMDRGDPEAAQRDLAYEFDVKEQDRWLPIANGWFLLLGLPPSCIHSFLSKIRVPPKSLLHQEIVLCMVSLLGSHPR